MMSESLYVLYMEKEANNVCLQWYYFEVKNTKPGLITFKIANLGKFESLYNEGMKPLIKSVKSGNEWVRGGSHISYMSNSQDYSYTLTFTYDFAYEDDTTYFAYSYPYTYNELVSDMNEIKSCYSHIARVDTICESLCGNNLFMITITEDLSSYMKFYEESYYTKISGAQRKLLSKRKQRNGCSNEHNHKKGIFITSRVHPGETVGSFMMQGVIDFLLSNSKKAHILRKNYVFKLIPMLNPDGVRHGKTRVSMLGVDLNRRWNDPNPIMHPTIFHAKKYLQVFSEMHECLAFCDFHGHSTKRNVFFYGCNLKPVDLEQNKKNLMARMVPFLLSKKNKLVSYKDSRFYMQKCKESTARIVVYRQFNVINSLTLEASFYGPSSVECFKDGRSDMHMRPEDLKSVGQDFCLVFLSYLSPSSCIKNLQNLSNYMREAMGLKSKTPELYKENPLDSGRQSSKGLNAKDLLDYKEVWDEAHINDIDYYTEESEESSPSDIDEYEKQDCNKKKSKKNEIIRKPYRMVTPPPGITRRPVKIIKAEKTEKSEKAEKNEIIRSPEAYFKMPGISVFSFNLRAKSSENIFQGSLHKIKHQVQTEKTSERPKTPLDKPPDIRNHKVFICNPSNDSKNGEKNESPGKMKVSAIPGIDQLYKSWIKSKSSLVFKSPDVKKPEGQDAPIMQINRAQIHLYTQKN